MTQVEYIIKIAQSFLGSLENSSQHKEIIKLYNEARDPSAYIMTVSDPWCAAFVVAVFQKAGYADLVPCFASCDQMVTWFQKHGQLVSWKESPHVGDLVFYNWNNDNVMDHVGIVTKNQFGNLTIIEGNCSDTVKYRNIYYTNAVIKCYGRPKYDSRLTVKEATINPIPATPWQALPEDDRREIDRWPLLYEGSNGVWVKVLQVFLRFIAADEVEVDGEFGPITKDAVMSWQQCMCLEVDGIVGRDTWSSFFTE